MTSRESCRVSANKSISGEQTTPEDVTALLRKRPFVPLRIHMTDGHTYEIHHPEAMVVSRSHAMVGLHPIRRPAWSIVSSTVA